MKGDRLFAGGVFFFLELEIKPEQVKGQRQETKEKFNRRETINPFVIAFGHLEEVFF